MYKCTYIYILYIYIYINTHIFINIHTYTYIGTWIYKHPANFSIDTKIDFTLMSYDRILSKFPRLSFFPANSTQKHVLTVLSYV